MTPAALVATLRARGVTLRPDGDRLRVRPAEALAPDELEALRQHKAEVLAMLAPVPTLTLDPATVRDVLGRDAGDPHAVALRFEVLATVRRLEQEIASGKITPGLRLIRGRPLADWLDLDEVARLLRAWGERRANPRGADHGA